MQTRTARRLTAAALILPLLITAGAASAAASGTVTLSGSVDTDCALSINDHGRSVDIVNGVTDFTLGSVGERCNSGSGYTITITSKNGGAMLNGRGDSVGYSVRWNDSGWIDLDAPVVLNRNSARTAIMTRSFRVTVPAQPQAIAGDYEDTITLTIAAR